MSSPAVVCLGEILYDLVALDADVPLEQACTFRMAPGGAPANVAVALSRLGVDAAFIGQVGTGAFGLRLRETLRTEGVDIRGLRDASSSAPTTLAFVGSDGAGGRRFEFHYEGTASALLAPDDVDLQLVGSGRIFHFGSVTLAAESSALATRRALECAREREQLVTFDPNIRLELWPSEAALRSAVQAVLPLVDVVKMNADELPRLAGTAKLESACAALRLRGPALCVVTLGVDGCYFQTASGDGYVPVGVHVDAIDTLGAGDAFMAGLLTALASSPNFLGDGSALRSALRFANAVGTLTTTRIGAIPALPTRAEVDALLAAHSSAWLTP